VVLQTLPIVFVLVGLVFYVVLGGADFGAGLWQLVAGRGVAAERLRDHAHNAMGPVWEANHVWLIFVLTVLWTAYPQVFASIASTLSIPFFAAAVGIVLRGGAYALRSGTRTHRELLTVEKVLSVSSILTPMAFGMAVGAIAGGRVPVGNAAGNAVSSWLNPLSITIGVIAVGFSAYLAAVFLSADAVRRGNPDLEQRFRTRALGSGVVAGVASVVGLVALRSDAPHLYHRLLFGRGVPALAVSVIAGVATLALVRRRRYEPARYTAALAVAAVVAGWALAQAPDLLPGLTIEHAAAPRDTLIALTIAVIAGGIIVFPSLAALFRLVLAGRLEPAPAAAEPPAGTHRLSRRGLAVPRAAIACLVAGVGFLSVADAGWAHAIGVAALFAFAVLGSAALISAEVLTRGDEGVSHRQLPP
jgi:cytochrome d ubiquinol oxidase subunit II